MSDLVVTMRHVRAAKLCSRGARAWCEANGFSWSVLLDGGLSAEELERTGDPLALRAVAAAREEAAAHG